MTYPSKKGNESGTSLNIKITSLALNGREVIDQTILKLAATAAAASTFVAVVAAVRYVQGQHGYHLLSLNRRLSMYPIKIMGRGSKRRPIRTLNKNFKLLRLASRDPGAEDCF